LIIPDALKKTVQECLSEVQVPYVLVSQDKLKRYFAREKELMEQKCKNVMRRALIRSGSVPFIHNHLPLFESPTMIIGT
jgi:hypothetical protein